jgi:energy-coupling factor transporter ATP-binding protein EcfA2
MLALRKVCFGYRDREEEGSFLLDGVNLTVKRGGYVAILGRNAAGKTTLAKLMKGLLHPSSGEIRVDGQPIYPGKGGFNVGLILSNPDDQLLFPTVEEEMVFGLECMGVERETIQKRMLEYLGLLEMEQSLRIPLHFLSRGQRQRVAIAAVLALEPNYLLLDEATCALDPGWRSRLMSILSALRARRKMAIIHFTTSLEEAHYARLILILEDGRFIANYTPAEILSLPRGLTETGYPLPPVVELSLHLEQMGYPISPGIVTAEEMETFLLSAMRD